MVWRKKKTSAEALANSSGTHSLESAATGTKNHQTSAVVRPTSGVRGLSPQNGDEAQGSWLVDAEEFKVAVRPQGAQRPYTIPRNYLITGDMTSARRVVIEGEFAGGLLDAPTVTVTAGGSLRGRVKAAHLQVAGSVDADVLVGEALEVSGRGQLAGHIQAPQVKVWPGAVLHGAVLTVGGNTAQTAKG